VTPLPAALGGTDFIAWRLDRDVDTRRTTGNGRRASHHGVPEYAAAEFAINAISDYLFDRNCVFA